MSITVFPDFCAALWDGTAMFSRIVSVNLRMSRTDNPTSAKPSARAK